MSFVTDKVTKFSYSDVVKKFVKTSTDVSSFNPINIPSPINLDGMIKIDPYVSENIRISDINDGLKNYHYLSCDLDSSEDIKRSRGIIRDELDNNCIVRRPLQFTPEVPVYETDLIKELVSGESQIRYYNAIESSTIYVYYHHRMNKWRISTHQKIDAFKSRWGGPKVTSFGDNFIAALYYYYNYSKVVETPPETIKIDNVISDEDKKDAFELFTNNLDKNQTHAFILTNTSENRIVCQNPIIPMIYHVASIDNKTGFLLEGNFTDILSLPVMRFKTIDHAIEYVNNIDYNYCQGLVLFMPNQKQLKILNNTYYELFQARGNEPSIKFRYLQIRNDPEMINKLYYLYPQYIDSFNMYETILEKSVKRIYNAYIDRYINNKYVIIPQNEYFVMQSCHSHINLTGNTFTPEIVRNIMRNQLPTLLNKIIKEYIKND